jgi:predicted nucleic-acid-binding Zn-ribbon protein
MIMKKLTTEIIIKRFFQVRGSRYDYSQVVYDGSHQKVKIKCLEHGYFHQSPLNHLQGHNCPKCKVRDLINRQTKTKDEFVSEAIKIHGDKYCYDLVVYNDGRIPVKILCSKHGTFLQIPRNHIHRQSGCPHCALEDRIKRQTYTTDDFIKKSTRIHGDRYKYNTSIYSGYDSEIDVECRIHGIFRQVAGTHMNGHGCPKCSRYISAAETNFLDCLRIPIKQRHVFIKPYKVDGYDPNTKTIYEFLGDFFHGNPKIFNSTEYNKMCKMNFGKLYDKTFERLHSLKRRGYNVKYIWESEWKKFCVGIEGVPPLHRL